MEELMEPAVSKTLAVISVCYEGNDAASHEIDLNQLGQSIQGFAAFLRCARMFCSQVRLQSGCMKYQASAS